MKKLITIAALASVAFTTDFLGHNRPDNLKEGGKIVKEVKSHNIRKLIKSGGKISKDLALEDLEFLALSDVERLSGWGSTKQRIAELEKEYKEYEEITLPLMKKNFPSMYQKALEEHNRDKKELADLVRETQVWDNVLKSFTESSRMLQAEDHEFIVERDYDAELRQLKEDMVTAEKSLRERESELPFVREKFPLQYPQFLETYNILKGQVAELKKLEVQSEELIAQYKSKPKSTGDVINFLPKRKLQAEDHEFIVELDDIVAQMREDKEKLVLVEKTIGELEGDLPWVKKTFPLQYPEFLEKLNLLKGMYAEGKKKIAELEELIAQAKSKPKSTGDVIKFQPKRKLQAVDDELFNLGELLKEGKKIRDEIKHH